MLTLKRGQPMLIVCPSFFHWVSGGGSACTGHTRRVFLPSLATCRCCGCPSTFGGPTSQKMMKAVSTADVLFYFPTFFFLKSWGYYFWCGSWSKDYQPEKNFPTNLLALHQCLRKKMLCKGDCIKHDLQFSFNANIPFQCFFYLHSLAIEMHFLMPCFDPSLKKNNLEGVGGVWK